MNNNQEFNNNCLTDSNYETFEISYTSEEIKHHKYCEYFRINLNLNERKIYMKKQAFIF